jgi:hypothetical protein
LIEQGQLLFEVTFCLTVYCETEFKNLRSLEICSGGLTDAGVKNIKELSSLMCLNLSQNSCLTDKTVELIAGKFVGLYFCLANTVFHFACFAYLLIVLKN